MFTQNDILFFVGFGAGAGMFALVILHSIYKALCEKWEAEHPDTLNEDWGPIEGYTTMEVPDAEYRKLAYIYAYGVESFIDACKRGDFSIVVGGEE